MDSGRDDQIVGKPGLCVNIERLPNFTGATAQGGLTLKPAKSAWRLRCHTEGDGREYRLNL